MFNQIPFSLQKLRKIINLHYKHYKLGARTSFCKLHDNWVLYILPKSSDMLSMNFDSPIAHNIAFAKLNTCTLAYNQGLFN